MANSRSRATSGSSRPAGALTATPSCSHSSSTGYRAGNALSSEQATHATLSRRSRTQATNSSHRRVFPMPASPATITNRPVPERACFAAVSSESSSASRPTNLLTGVIVIEFGNAESLPHADLPRTVSRMLSGRGYAAPSLWRDADDVSQVTPSLLCLSAGRPTAQLSAPVLAMAPQPRPSTWDEASPRLLPADRSASWVALGGLLGGLRRPIAPFVSLLCAIDSGHAMTFATESDLKAWRPTRRDGQGGGESRCPFDRSGPHGINRNRCWPGRLRVLMAGSSGGARPRCRRHRRSCHRARSRVGRALGSPTPRTKRRPSRCLNGQSPSTKAPLASYRQFVPRHARRHRGVGTVLDPMSHAARFVVVVLPLGGHTVDDVDGLTPNQLTGIPLAR